ncbi:hypothetical protein A4R26_06350 [Niastella populi]|uniref:Uncharacterized protein n=1 Tax=Niastella populi TaxID=550983 RepID=A0A1V9F5A7_9BACT|nr:hypothetical protein A4R26_06350 [Niastella populi]
MSARLAVRGTSELNLFFICGGRIGAMAGPMWNPAFLPVLKKTWPDAGQLPASFIVDQMGGYGNKTVGLAGIIHNFNPISGIWQLWSWDT